MRSPREYVYIEKRGGPRTEPWASSMWRGCGDVEDPAKGLRRDLMRWEKIQRRVWSAGSQVKKLFPGAEKEGSQEMKTNPRHFRREH